MLSVYCITLALQSRISFMSLTLFDGLIFSIDKETALSMIFLHQIMIDH
jgi:hypothetical protein